MPPGAGFWAKTWYLLPGVSILHTEMQVLKPRGPGMPLGKWRQSLSATNLAQVLWTEKLRMPLSIQKSITDQTYELPQPFCGLSTSQQCAAVRRRGKFVEFCPSPLVGDLRKQHAPTQSSPAMAVPSHTRASRSLLRTVPGSRAGDKKNHQRLNTKTFSQPAQWQKQSCK